VTRGEQDGARLSDGHDGLSSFLLIRPSEHLLTKESFMRTKKFLTGVAAAALVLLPLNAAAADTGAEVVIVHGVPGLEVDILVDGAPFLRRVNFGDTAVTALPAGNYTLAVAAVGSTTPILSLDATLVDGLSVTVAAHLDAAGAPVLAAYQNLNRATGIQPFHLANFGAVDILSGTTAVLSGVTNGQTARIDVAGGTTVPAVGIGAAGSGTAAISLGDVTVPNQRLILAYAIGPNTGQTLPTVVTVVIGALGEAGIPSGEAGLADRGLPMGLFAVMLVGGLLLVAPSLATRRQG